MELDKYIKRKTLIVQILLLITILYLIVQSIVLVFVGYEGHDRIHIDFLRQFTSKRQAFDSIKPFYPKNGILEYIDNEGDPILGFRSFDMEENVYNGFGVFKSFKTQVDGKLYLTWRGSGLDVPVSIHLSDQPPKDQIGKVGEDYIYDTQPPGRDWEELIIPLSNFEYNQWWQPDNVFDDGKLDFSNLYKLEFSFNSTEDVELEFKDVYIKLSGDSSNYTLMFIFYIILGLFLFIRTILSLENYIRSIYVRIAYSISVMILVFNFFFNYNSESYIQLISLMAIFSLLYLIDELTNHKINNFRYMQLRFLFIYLLFFSIDLNLLTRLFLVQMIVYPSLSKRDKSMFLLTALGLMIYHIVLAISDKTIQEFLYPTFVLLLNYISLEIVLLKGDRSQLESALTLYNGIFHHSRDFIFTTDTNGNLTSINRAFSHLLNKSTKELLGCSVLEFIPPSDRNKFGIVNRDLKRKINRFDTKLGVGEKVNRVYICETPILVKGKLVGHQVLATDITDRIKMEEELREANKQLEMLVDLDGLTQIANRRFFDRHLDIEVKRFLRSGKTLSLLLLDVDYFKKYNDFYGHQKGDDVLKMLASTLNTTLHRGSDLVARYGGEEFVIILPDTDVSGAEVVAQRLIDAIQHLEIPHEQSEVSKFVSISVGISSTLEEEERTTINQMLVERADKGLYKAKESGRNRFCTWL